MPTPLLEPTLLELLEDTAAHVDCFASAEGPHDNCNARKRADRIRAAAARLARELELFATSSDHWNSLTLAALLRVNGGPLPTTEEKR